MTNLVTRKCMDCGTEILCKEDYVPICDNCWNGKKKKL